MSPPPLNPVALTGAQRRHLRGLGHHLHPVVKVGRQGVTEGVVEAAVEALDRHELIKVSVGRDAPEDRHEAAEALGQATGAHVAQVIGRTALLYRRRHEAPEIFLPGAFVAGPKPAAPSPNKGPTPGPNRGPVRARAEAPFIREVDESFDEEDLDDLDDLDEDLDDLDEDDEDDEDDGRRPDDDDEGDDR